MMTKIRVLSEQTINQIAAGEVVESPASVVKELIENAVDAGASRVVIEVMGGGYHLIRVSDDAAGMPKEDALLCLERHATSKIESVDDLDVLSTMGFRGEALASIASISKMRIATALDAKTGTEVEVEGGKVVHVGELSRGRGTTMEVRSLFYNVPARKKFQKAPSASVADVTRVVTQQALAHPEMGFELIVQDRVVFSVAAAKGKEFVGGLSERSAQLLGGSFQTDVFAVDLKEGICRLQGVIGSPFAHRHNRTGQYLFINQRPVVCPAIAYAIRDAYGTRLPSDRHPIFSLHLQIPPTLVDVNVHPQKKEVRLRDERGLRASIHKAVNLALQRGDCSITSQVAFEEKAFVLQEAPSWLQEEALPASFFREEKTSYHPELLPKESTFRSIGIFSHYFIVESQGDLVLVDLQSSQARIAFEMLIKGAAKSPVRQGLLIPVVLSVSAEEEALLQAYEEQMAQIGFDLRLCGKNQFIVDAVPPFVDAGEVVEVLREVLSELNRAEVGSLSADERLRQLAQSASRFARGRKKVFMLQEAKEILKQLMQTSSPQFCPRGSLTMAHVSSDEIEKKFFSAQR